MTSPYERLGRIIKSHGTGGEVSVALRDGLSSALLEGCAVWIVPPPPAGAVPRRIESVRSGPKGPLVRVAGGPVGEDLHELAGRTLLVHRDALPPEVHFDDDLTGMRVNDDVRGPLGTVVDVIRTGANDVLVVDGPTFGEVLIPVIDDVILRVDRTASVIEVALLDGLIDEERS